MAETSDDGDSVYTLSHAVERLRRGDAALKHIDPWTKQHTDEEVAELAEPLLRRQVWLTCGSQTLGWAESWWNQAEAEAHLQDRRLPIWRSLSAGRAELYREVDGFGQVQEPWLQERFGHAGPFWSRHYRFFRHGRELTVIREVFSPALELWLGPAQAESVRKDSSIR